MSPSKYRAPGEVLKTYQRYCNQKDIGKVAIALAKLTYFGRQEMSECTITGHNRSTQQFSSSKLASLKQDIRSVFPSITDDEVFDKTVWKKCTESIAGACKHLRSKS